MACGVHPMTTEKRKKTEINTKEPKALSCCSLTPYHFTPKASIHKGLHLLSASSLQSDANLTSRYINSVRTSCGKSCTEVTAAVNR
ncbi:hypothetical protein INR49_025474 [Caranx melampygus]|nr:hypothetical protein INR49_025474 [Caranx melampygus]